MCHHDIYMVYYHCLLRMVFVIFAIKYYLRPVEGQNYRMRAIPHTPGVCAFYDGAVQIQEGVSAGREFFSSVTRVRVWVQVSVYRVRFWVKD